MTRTPTSHNGQSSQSSRTGRTGLRVLRRAAVTLGVAVPILLAAGATTANAQPLWPSPTPTPTAPAAPTGVPLGANFHGLWSTYSDAQRILILDGLKSAGVDSVRLDVAWAMLQPTGPGSYDAWGTAFVDRVIAMANARGIKPLVMLWTTPGWANNNAGGRVLPTNPADYARVAQWSAARWHGKVVGWEVWNEPNSNAFMVGADPVAYTRLLKAAYPAFKAGSPTTPVITGGVEYNDTNWLTRMYAAGAKGSFDAIATHPYMGMADASPTLPDDGTMWTFTHAAAVHRLMVANGDGNKKLWFTEFGWSTHPTAVGSTNWNRGVTDTTQADYTAKAASLVDSTMPYVARMYLYSERDTNTGNLQYDSYGIYRWNYTVKPVLAAIRAVNAT
jgi:hypothetical protein